ncbi:CotH kinase family protein [Paenibacillus rigui]|uniref:Spore coat protein CotH n=1 Tax=Paenibacillus rigui TaxID=554312 RepID=A0A229USP5_9BACL|nr:CotH kinase family protein [Paenibacillus rigui]OXM86657.1 hypothetical protein CF651_09425 [Paenibacillus rigui]
MMRRSIRWILYGAAGVIAITGILFFSQAALKGGSHDGQRETPPAPAKETETGKPVSRLPVVVIKANPDDLWSQDRGIYEMGEHASSKYPYKGANFWADRSIPVEMTLRAPDGEVQATGQGDAKIFGGNTRTLPQKALAVDFGKKGLNYPLFPQFKEIGTYHSIVLRNSGQDFAKTHFRDGMVSELLLPTGIDAQAYRPVIVYYNEKYMGVHDLREKIDTAFLADHHGGDAKQIDLLESNGTVKSGDREDFNSLLQLLDTGDVGNPETYRQIGQRIDIQNFIDYIVTEVYIANTDWPGHNIRYWKSSASGSKWRWIVYDTDESFINSQDDTLLRLIASKKAQNTNKPAHLAPYMLNKLLQNEEFHQLFIERFAYHMNHTFDPEHVVSVITAIEEELAPEMPEHLQKWGGTMEQWRSKVEEMKHFAKERPSFMFKQLQTGLHLTDSESKLFHISQ